jgi:hypothetical protein
LLERQRLTADLFGREIGGEGLLGRVRAALPATARPHCLSASLKSGELSVTVDSPVWATRVRYGEELLRRALSGEGCEWVKIRVRPPGAGAGAPVGARLGGCPRRLSAEVVAHLMEAADGIAVPELAQALRRLARRHQGRGDGRAD